MSEKESWIDKMIRYKKLIAGKWLTENKKHTYEFKPILKFDFPAKAIWVNLETNKPFTYDYFLIPQPPLSKEREDGVPVDQPILRLEFGAKSFEYEIKVITESMLIIFQKGKPETEEIMTKM